MRKKRFVSPWSYKIVKSIDKDTHEPQYIVKRRWHGLPAGELPCEGYDYVKVHSSLESAEKTLKCNQERVLEHKKAKVKGKKVVKKVKEPGLFWFWALLPLKLLVVTTRFACSALGPIGLAYSFLHQRALLGLDTHVWAAVTMVGFALMGVARLRRSEYIFDDIDKQLEKEGEGEDWEEDLEYLTDIEILPEWNSEWSPTAIVWASQGKIWKRCPNCGLVFPLVADELYSDDDDFSFMYDCPECSYVNSPCRVPKEECRII